MKGGVVQSNGEERNTKRASLCYLVMEFLDFISTNCLVYLRCVEFIGANAECLSVCAEFISANSALICTNKFCTFLFPYDIYTFRGLIFAGIYTLKELIFARIKFCGCLGTF